METRALTYRELAALLGVKLDSARKTVRRKGWPKWTGNDGTVRVLVPVDALPGPSDSPQDSSAIYTRELETRIEGLHMLLAAETCRKTTPALTDRW